MAFSPRGFLVPAPALPSSPCHGLFEVVEPRTITDPHWQSGGIEWEDFLCSPSVSGFVAECPPATFTKDAEREFNFCHADPFVVYGSFECATGGRPVREGFDISKDRLLAWEQWEVERIAWTGTTANGDVNPSFQTGNDTCGIVPVVLSSAGPLAACEAIAAMEEFLADLVPCGGIIHASVRMAAVLASHSLMVKEGDRFFTLAGTPIVFGAGYPGTGPGGAAPTAGATWMVATGPMVVVRGDVMMVPDKTSEAINRSINQIEVRAERYYSVGWSCGIAMVQTFTSCG